MDNALSYFFTNIVDISTLAYVGEFTGLTSTSIGSRVIFFVLLPYFPPRGKYKKGD